MSLVFRHPEPDDYDAIISHLDEWWGDRPMRAMLPRLFFTHFGDTSFVAEADGAIRGFLIGFLSPAKPDEAYVHFVGVDPAYRGRAIGRQLYERFFALAAAAGRDQVGCVTSPHNRASIAFHLGLGFDPMPGPSEIEGVPCWPEYDGPGEDRVVLVRRLEAPSPTPPPTAGEGLTAAVPAR